MALGVPKVLYPTDQRFQTQRVSRAHQTDCSQSSVERYQVLVLLHLQILRIHTGLAQYRV